MISDVDGEDIFQRAHDLVKYERVYFGYFRSTTSPGDYQEHIKAIQCMPHQNAALLNHDGAIWQDSKWLQGNVSHTDIRGMGNRTITGFLVQVLLMIGLFIFFLLMIGLFKFCS